VSDQAPAAHFVLTRFNIASPGREAPIRNAPGWLARRFDLFEAFCLPSMAAQAPGTFRWLIYFDEQTPAEFRTRIAAAQAMVPFDAIFVGPFRAGLAALDVAARLERKGGRLITTRLDNDDAVSSDFLARVKAEAAGFPDGTIINFCEGIALQNGRLYSAFDASNPFSSLVEQADKAVTIWAAPHTELAERFPLQQVVTDPCWLQVVHGENVANRIKGRRLADKAVLARFNLGQAVRIAPTGNLALGLDRMLLYPARRLRELAIRGAKLVLRRG
jgi:Putative rhamnosyl transferase